MHVIEKPWSIHPGDVTVIHADDGRPILCVLERSDSPDEDLTAAESHAIIGLAVVAPEMLAELEATAKWCGERADILGERADILGKLMGPSALKTILSAEAARFRGRAALIRQLTLKAKGAV
jgi:hypothetical protein